MGHTGGGGQGIGGGQGGLKDDKHILRNKTKATKNKKFRNI